MERLKTALRGNGLLVLGICLVIFAICLDRFGLPVLTRIYSAERLMEAKSALSKRERAADKLLEKVSSLSPAAFDSHVSSIYSEASEKNVYLFVYDGSNLVFWTTNSVVPTHFDHSHPSFLQHLDNGIYVQQNIQKNGFSYIALIPVQYSFSIENQYLRNRFLLSSSSDLTFIINESRKQEGTAFFSNEGNYLFSVATTPGPESFGWISWLFLAGVVVIAIRLGALVLNHLNHDQPRRGFLMLLIALTLFAFCWKVWRLPAVLYESDLFSPKYYASSTLFSSLGDLLVFTLTCAVIILFSVSYFSRTTKVGSKAIVPIISFVLGLGAVLIQNLTRSLILDSQISFDLANVFGITFSTFIGLAVIFLWLVCWVRIYVFLVSVLQKNPPLPLWLAGLSLVATALPAIFFAALYAWLFADIFFLFALIFCHAPNVAKRAAAIAILPAVCLYMTILFADYNRRNTLESKKVIAAHLVSERDAIAEYLFPNIYRGISSDYYVKSFFTNPIFAETFLEKRIRQLYFSGYYGKYDVSVSCFSPEGLPYRMDLNKPLTSYLDVIGRGASPVISDYLYFQDRYIGLPSYIAVIPIYRDDRLLGTILLQLQQKSYYDESVYPELLLSENVQRVNELNEFSHAVYTDGILVSQKGNFPYAGTMHLPKIKEGGTAVINEGEYEHLIYAVNTKTSVLVTSRRPPTLSYLSTFSFLVFLFGFGVLIGWAIPRLTQAFGKYGKSLFHIRYNPAWNALPFRFKIFATIIAALTMALFIIGFVTVEYIVFQYNRDEQENLDRKTRAVTARLETDLQTLSESGGMGEEDMNTELKSLSELQQTDINLFDVQGNLMATTQGLIYDRKILAPRMDAGAFISFITDMPSLFTHEENIGSLEFTSAYAPLRTPSREVGGYVNLPYFSKEKELADRISSFLVALINLYLLLFLVLVALGIFMGRVLTVPLDIIRSHIRQVSLRGKNEYLSWNSDDEIGGLVKEYNDMLMKLEETLDRIKESVRESAWRDAARRTAHEIKNPLTPMKLHLQRLQLAFEHKDPDREQQFKRVSALLLDQISELSRIADSFREKAEYPESEPEIFDVKDVLPGTIRLFDEVHPVDITEDISTEEMKVFMDRGHFGKVISNLIKNAIQSIPEDREGKIKVTARPEGAFIRIDVADNGTGIPAELQDKVFVPSFSTKSAGMGLGLNIVKNMVEKAGGKIEFQTIPEHGTVFSVYLPTAMGA